MPIINRIVAALVGLLVLCGVAQANYVGVPPLPGGDAALIDQNWLLGLAGGQNQSKLFGITAHAGGGQPSAYQLLPGIALFQVDTVVTVADSVALPACHAPFQILVRNNGANALQMFAYPRSTDTINQTVGSTGIALAANTVTLFACIKDGQWSTVSGSGGSGSGSVTSVTGGCGLTNTAPNPITSTGTANGAIPIGNTVTSSPYTFQTTDACNLLLVEPGASVLTLPATSTIGFGNGNYWYVDNISATSVTLNVTSPSNFDGASSISIVNAKAFGFMSDGTNYHYTVNSSPGIGTVTNVSGACGISVVNGTSSPTVSSNTTPVIVTGANPAIVTGYCGEAIYLNNGSNQVPTIAQAGSTGFPVGWQTLLCNIGGGTQTVTPSAGTIGGLASYLLAAGSPAAPVCVGIISDGTSNYDLVNGPAGTVTSVSAACGNTTNGGAITTAGTVTGQITTVTSASAAYAILAGSCGGIVYLNNAGSPVPTIAEAGSTGFPLGWFTDVCNIGSAAQVLTPGAGTVGGASTKSISSGSAASPTCIRIISDGTSNYTIR